MSLQAGCPLHIDGCIRVLVVDGVTAVLMFRPIRVLFPVIALLVAGARTAAQSDAPANYANPASVLGPAAMEGTTRALSPNMMVAQTGPNTYRAALSMKPNHYLDSAGKWQPIAPHFSQLGIGQNAQILGDGSLVQTRLPATHAASPTIVKGSIYYQQDITIPFTKTTGNTDRNGVKSITATTTTEVTSVKIGSRPMTVTGEVQWTPTRMIVSGATAFRAGVDASSIAVASPNGIEMVYPHTYGAISERVTMLAEGMKDDFIIPSASALPSMAASTDGMIGFESAITLSPGLGFYSNGVLQTSDFTTFGELDIRDGNGRRLFLLPPVTASDGVSATVSGRYNIDFVNEGIYLTAEIPVHWLLEPDRKWPVAIDPTVFIYPSTADAFIYGPNPNGNYGSATSVLVGDQFNSLVRWDISSLPADAMIDISNAWLYYFNAYSYLTDTIRVAPVTSDWTESTVTWNSRQLSTAWTTPGGDAGNILDVESLDAALGWKFFIITDVAAQWHSGTLNNYGLLFTALVDGSNTGFYKNFYSRNNATLQPEIYFDYTTGSIFLSPLVPAARGVPSPDHFAVSRGAKWDAIAMRPPAGSDYDMFLASTNNYSDALTASGAGVGIVDYFVINGNYSPASNFYPEVHQYSGTGNYRIEQATNTENINGYATYGPYSMPANDVVRVWNASLPSGNATYFRVRPVSGDAKLSMALHWTNPADTSTIFQGRGQEVASSTGGGAGKDSYMSFTPSATDDYGLVVLNSGATVDTSYYLDVSTTPFPRAYLPTILDGYPFICDQFDPDETEAQRHGPMLSGVTYQARLCKSEIDKFYINVSAAGTLQVSITVPSSLLVDATHGASISVYHPVGNDTPLSNCSTPAPKGGYYVPLTQITTVFTCPVSSAGQYRINLYTTNSSTIFDDVNYYKLRMTFP